MNVPNVTKDFKTFLVGNNILTVMAAVTIAFSTGIMIRSLVSNVVIPGIYTALSYKIKMPIEFSTFSKSGADSFIKDFVSWIFVIILTFILIEYFIRRWMLKMPTTLPDKKSEVKPEIKYVVKQENKKTNSSNLGGGDDGGDAEFFYSQMYR